MGLLRLNIRYLRAQHGLTQAQMAEILSVSRDNVASYERGTNPPVEIVHAIVNHFQVSFNDIMEKELSLLESQSGKRENIDLDRIKGFQNIAKVINDSDNPIEIYRSKSIQSLERVIEAQEITIQTQKEIIQTLREVLVNKK